MSGGGSLRTSGDGVLAARPIALRGAGVNERRGDAVLAADLRGLLVDGDLADHEDVPAVEAADDALEGDGPSGSEFILMAELVEPRLAYWNGWAPSVPGSPAHLLEKLLLGCDLVDRSG